MVFPAKGLETAKSFETQDKGPIRVDGRALFIFSVLVAGLMVYTTMLVATLLYSLTGPAVREDLTAFVALITTVPTAASLIVAIYAIWHNATSSRIQSRKQHTITILFQTRLSSEIQNIHEQRRKLFPEFRDITYERWNAARRSPVQAERNAADAVTRLLNYFEFIAVGIRENDLDHDMLKSTIRGQMCNLVDDARDVIAHLRDISPRTYQHLVELYDTWRIEGARDINGNPNERSIAKIAPLRTS